MASKWSKSLARYFQVGQWMGQSTPGQKMFNAFWVVCLLILYVGWVLRGESRIRQTDRLKREIGELNAELTYEKSKLMQESRQSKIVQKVAPMGLQDYRNQQPPVKVVVPTE
ncbi:FtsL-like putative cell division protein [Siphonobacter aquaeclarae]|jgi:hypothetical protein|uniref:Cell division protein FtsL n=1 Tax=Siphonobacter aquaeclarae TaxID=563176 RepID=A0A1G9PWV5_9BACT|nr:FtsL-like putative cell division protein [Siphonobacter aquaeclarae]SDM03240.1 hypothetical protein SAMN04488090_2360 [Siphonobacter aquaeclarae]